MLELHGWLKISSSPAETETEPEDTDAAVQKLRTMIEPLAKVPGLMDVRYVNGEAFWHFGTLRNHRSSYVEELLGVIHEFAAYAAGSYGLVYVYDDEDERRNDFQVLVVRRGEVLEPSDMFLSPIVPTLEDEPIMPPADDATDKFQARVAAGKRTHVYDPNVETWRDPYGS
jgi:hypothetical protein